MGRFDEFLEQNWPLKKPLREAWPHPSSDATAMAHKATLATGDAGEAAKSSKAAVAANDAGDSHGAFAGHAGATSAHLKSAAGAKNKGDMDSAASHLNAADAHHVAMTEHYNAMQESCSAGMQPGMK